MSERLRSWIRRLAATGLALPLTSGAAPPAESNDGGPVPTITPQCIVPTYGVTWATALDPRQPTSTYIERHGVPARAVVLIHGLDDPGWMWRDVAPALRARGFAVARMEYPNDDAIGRSAGLFAESLAELRAIGVERVDIVAHSMGGLVSREMLTAPALYAGDGTGGTRYPVVDRLLMCGTPNHGSEWARVRGLSEFKEHVDRAFRSGGDPVLGSISDGSGQAALELRPGSSFLTALNARPQPTHTVCSIIAGRLSPVTADDVGKVGQDLQRLAQRANAPQWLRDLVAHADREVTRATDMAIRGIGDGCVTCDSARLAGVDDVVEVSANHVNMIVRVIATDPDPPPAIPWLLERLGAPKVETP